MTRAMSRRTMRTRAVSCNCPLAFWNRKLNRSFLSLRASSLSWSSVMTRRSERRPLFFISLSSFRDALDEARLDRQLRGGELKRFARETFRHAVDFEHDAARRDAHDPELRRALAFAHAHFDRLLRHRHVREHADPDASGALHVAGQRAAGGLELPRGHAFRLQRLQAVFAEVQREAALRIAVDTAFEGFAEPGFLGLHHGSRLSLSSRAFRPLRGRGHDRGRGDRARAARAW